MCKKFQRRNALIIILIGSILGAFICSEYFILNTTASVPRGLWLKLDCLPQKGDFVQVPIDAFSSTEWVPPEYFRKNIWGKNKPFLKRVAGLHGDFIEQGDNGLILINGVPFPDSAPLSHDRAGRFLKASVLPIVLTSDEVWLMSDSPFGFDSRYLGTAKLSKCHKAVPLLTF
ncbi:MAG: S26 family signal peptidase [Synergistaceae bacterium]|nr:S26 family signal peptidase [Synergistaceae bacterium]